VSAWGQLAFQDARNTIIECIVYFHDYLIIILLIILTFVVYFILYIIRHKNLDKVTIESHRLELIWTVIPIVILVRIAYPSLIMLYFIESSENSNIEQHYKVIGHQWYWEYEVVAMQNRLRVDSYDRAIRTAPKFFYTLETTQRLNLPINQMILFYITRVDVLHAFTVPVLGVKVDAIPGRVNTLNFTVNTPGVYYGQCREICGANHRFIPIHVLAN